MRIKELIKELTQIENTHGNLVVWCELMGDIEPSTFTVLDYENTETADEQRSVSVLIT